LSEKKRGGPSGPWGFRSRRQRHGANFGGKKGNRGVYHRAGYGIAKTRERVGLTKKKKTTKKERENRDIVGEKKRIRLGLSEFGKWLKPRPILPKTEGQKGSSGKKKKGEAQKLQ